MKPWRELKEERKAVRDREFIAKLREVGLHALLQIARNHSNGSAPEWKRVAIERELTRRGEVWP